VLFSHPRRFHAGLHDRVHGFCAQSGNGIRDPKAMYLCADHWYRNGNLKNVDIGF
jgi:hypothetical protein